MSSQFTHLHVHSHYSLLDGLSKIPDLVAAAAEKKMQALALTDHGSLYGAIEFYTEAKKTGIKPIIGAEVYVAPESMRQKRSKSDADYFHMVLLAKNLDGYKNLIKLVTAAHLEGFYYKPRIDKDLLRRHAAGLIGLSGCLRGEIPRLLAAGELRHAAETAAEFQDIFEPESFYLEIQRNGGGETQNKVNEGLVKLSKQSGIAVVATSDSHYLNPADNAAQDVLVCIGTGRTVDDGNRLDMRGFDLHLASPEEMEELFRDLPEALANTGRIAGMVNLELPLGQRHFPSFPVPEGETADSHLQRLAGEGLAEHLDGSISDAEKKRLRYELDIILSKGYAAYFLVVADFVNWARSRGIITTTRGSAAGSLTAYALGITTINPVEYKLPFERFLNPYRPSPPDIDIDIADNRRDEVLQYVSEKYGRDKVAQIVTFGTMMARAAVRDVGRALGVPYSKCDKIAKMIPFGRQGFHMSIDRAVEVSPDLKAAYEKDPETKKIIELSKKLEGCARHASVHAAGVVIAPTRLTDFVPLQLDTDNKNIITQYDMYSVESAGLVKMDFLGIRNLSILGMAVDIARATRNTEIDLMNIPLDDKKTFDLLSSGRTLGVFQLGGSGMTKYLVDLKPTSVFDIMAMISLYRPGPMESIPEFIARKHDPSKIDYLDPRLKDILDLSYGVITYQEDVLLTAINIAGYTWEEADKLRKAMGKKIPKEMAAQKEKFIQGAIDGGMSSQKAVKLWALIEPFAAYGFGKAHAASYAMVAYQTAYMKANFPVEFMAAVMTAESRDLAKVAAAVSECAALGIEVLPPDVGESLGTFTVIDENHIRFGLSAIKNLGSDVIRSVIEERETGGGFVSLADFVRRIKTRNFNKKSWEALAKSGSLDGLGERNQMLQNTDSVLEYGRARQKQKAAGQSSLFMGNGGGDSELALKPAVEATEAEKLAWEKELLGLYVSSHPLKNHREKLQKIATPIKNITLEMEGQIATIGGIITRVQNIITKKGDPMCFADIEDLDGRLELVVFPNVYQESKTLLATDQIVLVRGKVNDKDGDIKLLADSIKSIGDENLGEWINQKSDYRNQNSEVGTRTTEVRSDNPTSAIRPLTSDLRAPQYDFRVLKIRIPSSADPSVFQKLKIVFNDFPGSARVSLVIPDREGTPREVKTDFTVDGSEEFKVKLKNILKESILR